MLLQAFKFYFGLSIGTKLAIAGSAIICGAACFAAWKYSKNWKEELEGQGSSFFSRMLRGNWFCKGLLTTGKQLENALKQKRFEIPITSFLFIPRGCPTSSPRTCWTCGSRASTASQFARSNICNKKTSNGRKRKLLGGDIRPKE